MSLQYKHYTIPLVVILSALVLGCGPSPPPDVLRAAKQGDADAQATLGTMYVEGDGIRRNNATVRVSVFEKGRRIRKNCLCSCVWPT